MSRPSQGIVKSRMSSRDVMAEAVAGVLQRPARSVLTAVGTVLGVGSLIAILGLTSTAASQIDGRFNELTATEITVDDIGGGPGSQVPLAFPDDADARMQALNGVTAAGVSWRVRLEADQGISTAPPGAAYASTDNQAQVLAASPGILRAVGEARPGPHLRRLPRHPPRAGCRHRLRHGRPAGHHQLAQPARHLRRPHLVHRHRHPRRRPAAGRTC